MRGGTGGLTAPILMALDGSMCSASPEAVAAKPRNDAMRLDIASDTVPPAFLPSPNDSTSGNRILSTSSGLPERTQSFFRTGCRSILDANVLVSAASERMVLMAAEAWQNASTLFDAASFPRTVPSAEEEFGNAGGACPSVMAFRGGHRLASRPCRRLQGRTQSVERHRQSGVVHIASDHGPHAFEDVDGDRLRFRIPQATLDRESDGVAHVESHVLLGGALDGGIRRLQVRRRSRRSWPPS